MHKYKIVDAHCDTIGEIYGRVNLYKNSGHLDLERINEYKSWMQIFAVWSDGKAGCETQKKEHMRIINHFFDEMDKNKDAIEFVNNKEQAKNAWQQDKNAAILSIEGADWVRSTEDIQALYDLGVRLITLTWNDTNALASGVMDKEADFGLTRLGKSAVRKMNELGMAVDVSHISEKAFWDVIETTDKPICASHSNSKTHCPHPRNLTDKQFCAIVKNGGVVGINYYPVFVSEKKKACIDDIITHIEHFCSLGGENNLGLGGDFDGIDYTPSDLKGAQDVYKLLDRLITLGYSDTFVRGIAGENYMRFFEKSIK